MTKTNHLHFKKNKILSDFENIHKRHKLSEIICENPKIIFLDLPAGYTGEEEIHENEFDLYVVKSGSGTLSVENTEMELEEGDMVTIPPRNIHKIKTSKGIKYIVVKIKE